MGYSSVVGCLPSGRDGRRKGGKIRMKQKHTDMSYTFVRGHYK
jgi:hypothetical protein